MKKLSKDYNKIIYSLCIQDIQNVAKENFGRELTSDEIKKIINPLGDRIPWIDAIYDAINDTLEIEKLNEYVKEYN